MPTMIIDMFLDQHSDLVAAGAATRSRSRAEHHGLDRVGSPGDLRLDLSVGDGAAAADVHSDVEHSFQHQELQAPFAGRRSKG